MRCCLVPESNSVIINNIVTAGDNHASSATPDACSREQQRHEVTGQSIAMLVGGTLVNALAFSGSNYLFSMLRSSDLNEERKRHNQAVEQLQAAQAEWS